MIEICFTGGETDCISFDENELPYEKMKSLAFGIRDRQGKIDFITESGKYFIVNPNLVSLVIIQEVQE